MVHLRDRRRATRNTTPDSLEHIGGGHGGFVPSRNSNQRKNEAGAEDVQSITNIIKYVEQ